MKISYAITVCNESREFRELLDFLVSHIRPEDEIVVLQDVSKESEEVNRVFIDFADYVETRVTSKFEGDFAAWKNMLNSYCKGDYIVQIDADEMPSTDFIEYLPEIITNNDVEIFAVPRKNTVEGLTQEDIDRWHWRITEDSEGHQLVNWPDFQYRVYKNDPKIRWEGKVHERPVGFRYYSLLPDSMFFWHIKGIDKQRAQNAYYNELLRK